MQLHCITYWTTLRQPEHGSVASLFSAIDRVIYNLGNKIMKPSGM